MKRRKSGGGGANWMDTYGDMVTLLLCFFVLLYSMSTIDTEKWIKLVQSFNPDAVQTQTDPMGNDGQVADPAQEKSEADIVAEQQEIDDMIEELYQTLQAYVSQTESAENISVTKGDGYVFISFNDAVFFDGDSYVLRGDGQQVLTDIGNIIGKAGKAIDELRVLGHTAQARVDQINNPTNDRFLASNRATVVTVFLQEMNILDPGRLISMGFGQWRPIAPNDNGANRAMNRRVEMIVTGKDVMSQMGDQIEQYYTQRGTEAPVTLEGTGSDTGAANG